MTQRSPREGDRTLKAPFPYFGGKARIADIVWLALGQPRHYLEPFFGSGAVLLARPGYDPTIHVETVCDADGLLANVWRAIQYAPDEVARVCDWPVNHADLMARRRVLNARRAELLDRLVADDKYFDAELAGYWVWKASCEVAQESPNARPHISNSGQGIHVLSLAHWTNSNPDADPRDPYTPALWRWMRALSERLRRVRVVCGDWTRICGGDWQADMGDCGIFFDPPYGIDAFRREGLYAHDSLTVADDVAAWCLERGSRDDHRIVLAGYEGEHEELIEAGWKTIDWVANGGYAHLGNGRGKENRKRERLFLSPVAARQYEANEMPLFSSVDDRARDVVALV